MKKILLILSTLLFLYGFSENKNYDNLNTLCRVWGFMKYHHPAAGDSTRNIDAELTKLVLQVMNVPKKECIKILSNWVDSYGEFISDKKFYSQILNDSTAQELVKLDWINKKHLGKELSEKLKSLRYAVREKGINVKPYHPLLKVPTFDTIQSPINAHLQV